MRLWLRWVNPTFTQSSTGLAPVQDRTFPSANHHCRSAQNFAELGLWDAWCAPLWMTCATWPWGLGGAGRWSSRSSRRHLTTATRSSSTCHPYGRSCCQSMRMGAWIMAPPDWAVWSWSSAVHYYKDRDLTTQFFFILWSSTHSKSYCISTPNKCKKKMQQIPFLPTIDRLKSSVSSLINFVAYGARRGYRLFYRTLRKKKQKTYIFVN